MMVLCFQDRKVEPSRIMGPHVELDLLEIVRWHDREAPQPQDQALQFSTLVVARLQPAGFPIPAGLSESYTVG
jgi:hypothetical protein